MTRNAVYKYNRERGLLCGVELITQDCAHYENLG